MKNSPKIRDQQLVYVQKAEKHTHTCTSSSLFDFIHGRDFFVIDRR